MGNDRSSKFRNLKTFRSITYSCNVVSAGLSKAVGFQTPIMNIWPSQTLAGLGKQVRRSCWSSIPEASTDNSSASTDHRALTARRAASLFSLGAQKLRSWKYPRSIMAPFNRAENQFKKDKSHLPRASHLVIGKAGSWPQHEAEGADGCGGCSCSESLSSAGDTGHWSFALLSQRSGICLWMLAPWPGSPQIPGEAVLLVTRPGSEPQLDSGPLSHLIPQPPASVALFTF